MRLEWRVSYALVAHRELDYDTPRSLVVKTETLNPTPQSLTLNPKPSTVGPESWQSRS